MDSGQDDLQRNKAHVHHGQIQRLSQLLRGHIADIGLLHDHHAGVGADLPVQLAIAHVNGKDLLRPLLEQAVRKAAGGGSRVAAHIAFRLYAKVPQGLFQLQAAPAHIGAGRPPDLDIHRLLIGNAGLVRLLAVHIDNAAHNDCLGLGAVFRKLALRQKHIQPFFNLHL